ncbi:Cytochrome c-type biogenesis protein CcmF [Sinobacterium norvegicum]|uniref:Cytochrome c-type biogenesis protein CcmF n=1 Tax=Sinobacterium norvegicum TaxID=1641715 RepID=A0ABN8EH41_9GAMM|nr:heme lyase CcmF/NrfE family subunit [Sinobacterium norvegicum]CAH0990384.1 Cytochrome c-type biogenesis protein CcmF [Sinobacterium norvegicum]
MIPELGNFSLVIAFCLSVALAVIPMAGATSNNLMWMRMSRPLAHGFFVFVLISFFCLTLSFIGDDFSVSYVANHSNTLMPTAYKFSAVWGGHEGSLLLWILILASWTLAVALFSQSLPDDMVARVLSVMGMIAIGFTLFILLTSNPFGRELPFSPTEGSDLNPLLQDFGLIVHPPMLYFGYVGFSVPFAFAIAALLSGRLDSAWARWSRPWTNIAWAFLTLGIALGSWWAYYELGWGGWWFWDPVENASFMPWLVGTALMHTLAVTEKRGAFKSWTVLLAIFAFSLSLLGTFLVRSGVLTSVHSFAADPERGLFILAFLGVVVGGSLLLYALRAPSVASKVSFKFLSREVFLLINNAILVVTTIMVLLGTLYPLLMDAMGLGKYSVGPPYFNTLFVPLMALLVVFMAPATMMRWKRTDAVSLKLKLWLPLLIAIVCGIAFPLFYDADGYSIPAAMAVTFAGWLVFVMIADLRDKTRNSPGFVRGLTKLTPSYWGMQLGHLGMAAAIIGVCLTSQYTVERDVRMVEGDTLEASGYHFTFHGTEHVDGPNYSAEIGHFTIDDGYGYEFQLFPEKRQFFASGQIMTEAAINAGIWRDVYIAMGEPLGGGAWAVRLHYKPFVRWMWLGAIFMGLGGTIAVCDKRYRLKRKAVAQSQPLDSAAATREA